MPTKTATGVLVTLRRHGTTYGYDKGCRCDECRVSKMARRRRARALARAANRPSYQRELAAGRALKERYRGSCTVCGKPTTGSDGPGSAPTLCVLHAAQRTGLARRGRGPTMARIVAYVGDETRRYTEIVEGVCITKGMASNRLNRLVSYGILERTGRGLYRRAAA